MYDGFNENITKNFAKKIDKNNAFLKTLSSSNCARTDDFERTVRVRSAQPYSAGTVVH